MLFAIYFDSIFSADLRPLVLEIYLAPRDIVLSVFVLVTMCLSCAIAVNNGSTMHGTCSCRYIRLCLLSQELAADIHESTAMHGKHRT